MPMLSFTTDLIRLIISANEDTPLRVRVAIVVPR